MQQPNKSQSMHSTLDVLNENRAQIERQRHLKSDVLSQQSIESDKRDSTKIVVKNQINIINNG